MSVVVVNEIAAKNRKVVKNHLNLKKMSIRVLSLLRGYLAARVKYFMEVI